MTLAILLVSCLLPTVTGLAPPVMAPPVTTPARPSLRSVGGGGPKPATKTVGSLANPATQSMAGVADWEAVPKENVIEKTPEAGLIREVAKNKAPSLDVVGTPPLDTVHSVATLSTNHVHVVTASFLPGWKLSMALGSLVALAVAAASSRWRQGFAQMQISATELSVQSRFAVAAFAGNTTSDETKTATSLARPASADATASTGATASATSDAPFDATTSIVGITAPFGYWDPTGLMKEPKGMDGFVWKSEATFHKYQTAEIKHGRVAMLAATGMLTATFLPAKQFEGVPAGWAALDAVPGAGASIGVLVLVAALLEFRNDDKAREPGNLGDPGQSLNPESFIGGSYSVDMRNMEINHGRLAMSAVITEFLVEYGTGLGPGQQLQSFASSGTLFAALAGLVLLFSQTPEYTEEEEKDILAKIAASETESGSKLLTK